LRGLSEWVQLVAIATCVFARRRNSGGANVLSLREQPLSYVTRTPTGEVLAGPPLAAPVVSATVSRSNNIGGPAMRRVTGIGGIHERQTQGARRVRYK